MDRILPLICIGGTAFHVDVVQEEFREYGNEKNRISFNALQGSDDGYIVEFDKRTKNIFSGKEEEKCAVNVITVSIPPIVRLDPVGLAVKLGKPIHVFMKMKDDTEW